MKPRIKVVRFKTWYHVALFSGIIPENMRYLSIVTVYTPEAGSEWISRIRGMNRRSLLALLNRSAVYVP